MSLPRNLVKKVLTIYIYQTTSCRDKYKFVEVGFWECRSMLSACEAVSKFKIRKLVELSGIEPLTSCVQGRRSPSWAIAPFYLSFLSTAALPLSLVLSHTWVCSLTRSGGCLAFDKKSCVKNSLWKFSMQIKFVKYIAGYLTFIFIRQQVVEININLFRLDFSPTEHALACDRG